MKIAVLFHRIGPYHHARLNALGQLCDTFVLELSSIDNTYQWDKLSMSGIYQKETLFNDDDIEKVPANLIYKRLNVVLNRIRPDVIALNGWSTKASLLTMIWCRNNNVPYIMMSESSMIDEKRYFIKEWLKSRIVKTSSAAIVGGVPHISYLNKLGVNSKIIFTGYDSIDNAYFIDSSNEIRHQAEELINKYSLPRNYFLASARFVYKKNINRLIEAFKIYLENNGEKSWNLVILGDGELRNEIVSKIESLKLSKHIHLPGFIQYNELPVYFGLAKAFVHASTTEQWGLVVNEAMASSLPVIVSNRCGCAIDLVHDGINGCQFNPYDTDDLASKLKYISSLSEAERISLGNNSISIISNYSTVVFANSMRQAAETAINQPVISRNLIDRTILKALTII